MTRNVFESERVRMGGTGELWWRVSIEAPWLAERVTVYGQTEQAVEDAYLARLHELFPKKEAHNG